MALDLDAMIERFQERAKAVKDRPLPPVEGDVRKEVMAQAQVDYQDFALIGDATATVEDGGIVVFRIDLRPPEAKGEVD